jgi:hypothetical protein
MESELKDAAERLMTNVDIDVADVHVLLKLVDPTPVDADWFRKIKLVEFPGPGSFVIGIRVDIRPGRNSGWIVEVDDTAIAIMETRGQLRCLCLGLGITLTE